MFGPLLFLLAILLSGPQSISCFAVSDCTIPRLLKNPTLSAPSGRSKDLLSRRRSPLTCRSEAPRVASPGPYMGQSCALLCCLQRPGRSVFLGSFCGFRPLYPTFHSGHRGRRTRRGGARLPVMMVNLEVLSCMSLPYYPAPCISGADESHHGAPEQGGGSGGGAAVWSCSPSVPIAGPSNAASSLHALAKQQKALSLLVVSHLVAQGDTLDLGPSRRESRQRGPQKERRCSTTLLFSASVPGRSQQAVPCPGGSVNHAGDAGPRQTTVSSAGTSMLQWNTLPLP